MDRPKSEADSGYGISIQTVLKAVDASVIKLILPLETIIIRVPWLSKLAKGNLVTLF